MAKRKYKRLHYEDRQTIEFGFNNAAEQFRKSYDALKMRLSLSAEYNTAPQVSETDTNSTESGV